ncbi:MAG: hypothetical protein J07HQW2_03682 [Haloquadratum walsbyi J07HQW2]|uniref:Uncharacterized protein n=1 Tax=Haloquadratum walsbyi J07HQW2 TaxID=1238425 RepID=U1PXK4_9EURY|nr:MAG: hypothetical protein J07HQW2_03682 [Haloquadratum walsbyi J07HQW2]
MPAAVQIRHGVDLCVPERFAVVLLVSGDDVPVETPVVALCLPPRVVHAGADGVEFDRATHHFPRLIAEAAEEVEDHAAVVFFRVSDARALLVIAVVEVTLVNIFFHEVRVRLPGMAGGTVVLGDDALHPVT